MSYTPPPKRFLGTGELARRYDKCPRTISRWIKNPPAGFPPAAKQNGRYIFDLDLIEDYERKLAASVRQNAEAA